MENYKYSKKAFMTKKINQNVAQYLNNKLGWKHRFLLFNKRC